MDGKTVHMMNPDHKVRSDITIEDPALVSSIQARIINRVVHEIAKVHQFHATRMKRYVCRVMPPRMAGISGRIATTRPRARRIGALRCQ